MNLKTVSVSIVLSAVNELIYDTREEPSPRPFNYLRKAITHEPEAVLLPRAGRGGKELDWWTHIEPKPRSSVSLPI